MVASRQRTRSPAGWRARASATLRIASSRLGIEVQSPSSSLILRERSAGSCPGDGASSTGRAELSGAGLMARLAQSLVSIDDTRNEVAAHDVGRGEADRLDAIDAVEQADRLLQPGFLAVRQVDLARIAGHRHFRSLAEPGEKHLHLHARRIL